MVYHDKARAGFVDLSCCKVAVVDNTAVGHVTLKLAAEATTTGSESTNIGTQAPYNSFPKGDLGKFAQILSLEPTRPTKQKKRK